MRILFADAGSSKTDWIKLTVCQGSRNVSEVVSTPGLSPVHHSPEYIEAEMSAVAEAFGDSIDRILFYGTGIGTPERAEKMKNCIANVFNCRDISAESDIAAAAKAVLGTSPGIACIMGTGSNSCHFDGASIDRKSASLGFILDDEGGGVAFGRRLLSDIFKGLAPVEILEKFHAEYKLDVPEVVDRLYRHPSPNRWIASFMPFIVKNMSDPYISELVNSQISVFLDREFCGYQEWQLNVEGVGFVGSLADLLSDRLRSEFDRRGWKFRGIIAKPIRKLIENFAY